MSQLLFDWLNEDVGLSRKVVAFGEDFKDGYLFGELLSKFNQQMDFAEFSTKGTPGVILSNFCMLEPSMRKIGVHFNSRVVTEIMAGKETVTKNLLYEMKTALEGIYRINKQSNNQLLHGTASDKALNVIKPARKAYEHTMSATFEKAVHSKMENSNTVMMEKVLRHHTSKATEYMQTMSTADSDAYNSYMDTRLREKEINRNKKEKADEFAKSREAVHVAQWKVNQRIAHDRRQLKAKVEQDVLTRKEGVRTRFLAATRQDTLQGVDNFNDRLEASLLVAGANVAGDADSLIKTTTNVPGDKTLSLMYVDPETQRKGLEATQKKMKEHHEDIAVRTLAHDQRRRKFLREYDTMQMRMSRNIFNTEVIAQMLNFAASEQVEQGLKDRVVNYKQIIPENRRNREQLMEQMAEADRVRGVEWDAVEAQREVHWTIGGAREAHFHRSDVLHTAVAAAERQISTTIALQTIDKLLDVVDWVASCRQVGVFYYDITEDPAVLTAPLPEAAPAAGGKKGKEKEKAAAAVETVATEDAPKPRSFPEDAVVPVDIWADAVKMFVAEDPVSSCLHIPAPLVVTETLWPFSISERPACAEIDWLFSKPFRGSQLLRAAVQATDAALTDAASVDSADVAGVTPLDLARGLANADVRDFVDGLNTADIPIGLGEGERALTVAPEPTEISTLYTPTWLTNVQPRHFLGEALIAVRCAVDPVPEEPAAAVSTTHIPLRAALCGVSELAKQRLVDALVKQIPGLTVITVAALVERAYKFHCDALAAEAAPVAEEPALVPLAGEGLDTIQESLELSEDSSYGAPSGPVAMELDETMESVEPSAPAEAASAPEADTVNVAPSEEPVPAAEPDPYVALARAVHDCLLAGAVISDELYVSLIVHAVQQIHVRNTGYVLQDFPSTKRQALLLMQAFSGMDYSAHRPQPADKASPYAPPSPAESWVYDVKKCGLDTIIHVDNGAGIGPSFEQRARVRTVTSSGEVVYITDDQTTIKGLEVVEDVTRPSLATGIDLTVADTANTELTTFLAQIRILDTLSVPSDATAAAEVAIAKAQELCERYIPSEYFLPGYLPGTEPVLEPEPEPEVQPEEPVVVEEAAAPEPAEEGPSSDAVEGAEGALPGAEEGAASEAGTAAAATEAAPADGTAAVQDEPAPEPVVEEVKEKYVYQQPPAIFQPNAIPVALADALLRMWNTSEEQSRRKSSTYFSAVRDVRYQMLQRRRAAFDAVSTLLVKLDNRQELFDRFRKSFNEVPSDMRFDPECVAELHLQTLELCDALVKMSEERKAAAEAYTKKVSSDAVVTVLQHRCRCESAAMAQSELQRFFVVLHLLFDYAKSVRGYEMHVKVLNELEATLPVTLPAESEGGKKDAKGKEAKKGKEVPGALVPFREPIAAVLVSRSSMEAVPEVNGGDEPADPKAKKAPAKEKKGAAAESGDPFQDIEGKILEELQKWRQGTFAVTREVYEKDEPLCSAIEQAIWYEAEKVVLSIATIRRNLESHVSWLDAAEQELGHVMRDMVSKRYVKELTAVNQLIERIESCIEDARAVPEFWLVSPDSIAVDPTVVWDEFQEHLPPHLRPPKTLQVATEEVVVSGRSSPVPLNSFAPTMSPANRQLLNKVKNTRTPQGPGFVPEHSKAAADLEGSDRKKLEKQPVNSKMTHLRRASQVPHTAEAQADEQFRKEMAIFEAKRLTFEDKLLKRRAEREKEFRAMGMSAVTAKLAAYNELLLDEQADMLDFEARNRPKRRPNSHAARRQSNAVQGARRPSSAVKSGAESAMRRPTSANAAMH